MVSWQSGRLQKFAKLQSVKSSIGSNPILTAKFNMNRRLKGNIGEAKVLVELITQGYEVFLPYSDGSLFDIIVYKNKSIFKVSVKYTSYIIGNNWQVALRNVSRRNNGEVAIKYFDNSEYDIIAVYIAPEDRVILINAIDVNSKSTLSIPKQHRPIDEIGST